MSINLFKIISNMLFDFLTDTMATGDGVSLQQAEVDALRHKFDKSCRVIRDVGDFAHVIDIKPTQSLLAFKFQLPCKVVNILFMKQFKH